MSEKKKKAQAAEAEQEREEVDHTAEIPQEESLENPTQDLEKEIEQLTEENKDLQDKLLRQMAEFDNFRKRTSKEKGELYDDATVKCVSQIVAVIDNFERALATPCEGNEDF